MIDAPSNNKKTFYKISNPISRLMKYLALLCLAFFVKIAQCSEPPKRISFGVSETKPNGISIGGSFVAGETESWKYTRSRSGVEAFNREPIASAEFQIEAYLIREDQPFESIQKKMELISKNIEEGYAQSPKWQKVHINLTPEIGKPRCMRGELLLREKTSVSDADANYSEQFFLSCALEKRAPFGLEVRYYHRYKGTSRNNEFTKRATLLLNSVEINDR